MKQFNFLISTFLFAIIFSSCEEISEVEQTLVIEQVNILENNGNKDCQTCGLEDKYKYKLKIKSHSGTLYYYTDYKHDVGDTLLSSHMFIQQEVELRADMKTEIKKLKNKNDSLINALNSVNFQYNMMVDYYNRNIIDKHLEKTK